MKMKYLYMIFDLAQNISSVHWLWEVITFCGMTYKSSSEETYEPCRAVGALMNDI